MYIEPNTVIKLYKNVPLNNTYTDTLYFESITKQNEYFHSTPSILVATLQRNSYQRVNKGKMRVSGRAENYYTINYLAFQNSSFGPKWFYAFVTSVEYINNETVEIAFEIDDMQTYLFDVELGECFVEREHSETDNLFESLTDEDISIGNVLSKRKIDYKLVDYDEEKYMGLCLLTVRDNISGRTQQFYNKIYNFNLERSIAPIFPTGESPIIEDIERIVDEGKVDKIVAIYEFPNMFYQYGDGAWDVDSEPLILSYSLSMNTHDIDEYVPRNKKLFNYPFNYFSVSNNCGTIADFKYEMFNRNIYNPVDELHKYECEFKLTGTYYLTPSVIMYPNNYCGIMDDYDSGLIISDFPTCTWSGDSLKEWWNANRGSMVSALISSSVSSTVGVGTNVMRSKDPMTTALGSVNTALSPIYKISSMIGSGYDAHNKPPQVSGKLNTEVLSNYIDKYKFSFIEKTITKEYAMIIDDYFDRYGYTTKRNKIPNRNVRPHWTYTKTIGCTLKKSNAPVSSVKHICNIYDNGITFWNNPSEVGDYSLDNRI